LIPPLAETVISHALAQVRFNLVAAKSNATLLMISVLSLCVPAMLQMVGQIEQLGSEDLVISRGMSIMLLLLYCMYIHFQLNTHRFLFEADNDDDDGDDDDDDDVHLSLTGALIWLTVVTVLIAILSEMLTGAIEDAAKSMGLGAAFVGFVILPIVGNAAEHSTAIVMAYKNKMDLALGVALGSSTQIALFVIPLMVLLGIPLGQPLDMMFGVFETAVTFFAALIVFMTAIDGETNWLEGAMLLTTYCIICFAFFFYQPTR